MRTWKDVATLVKTKNMKGRFVARAAAGLPFMLEEGMRVAFVPPQTDIPRSAQVTFVREMSDDSFEIEFDAITGEDDARALTGCHCLVRLSDLGEIPLQAAAASWEGWHICTDDGQDVGAVVDLIENPGQALLEVDRGPLASRAYIPLVEEFITDIDEEAQTITVTLPSGLLDL